MTTTANEVAVLGGGNTHLEYQLEPITTPSQKREARITTGLGGGGINFSTGLARLGVRTELHVLTVPEGSDDAIGAFFRAALGAHQRDLLRTGASLDVKHVGVLSRQPQAIIRPDLGDIVGDHGEYDRDLLARVTDNFVGELPPIRVLTTPRRVSADLGIHFLTVGRPTLKVVVCSGVDLWADRTLTERLFRETHLVFMNDLESHALCDGYLHELAVPYQTIFVVTSDRPNGTNRIHLPSGQELKFGNGISPPFSPETVDPAGTGDNFAATFLHRAWWPNENGHLDLLAGMIAGCLAGGIVASQRGSLAPADLAQRISDAAQGWPVSAIRLDNFGQLEPIPLPK